MRLLDLTFSVLVAGSSFRLVCESFFGDVEACGGESTAIEVHIRSIEDFFGGVGEGLGVKTFSSVLRDEACVSRDAVGSRRGGILSV